jgi:hypothetical protein
MPLSINKEEKNSIIKSGCILTLFFSVSKKLIFLKVSTKIPKVAPYPNININQIPKFIVIETITHPREKIDDKPKIFFKLFCFTLPSLPMIILRVPNIINKFNFLRVRSTKGINFCQIDKIQISPQFRLGIIFKYQN